MKLYNKLNDLRTLPAFLFRHSNLFPILLLCLGHFGGSGLFSAPSQVYAKDCTGFAGSEEFPILSDEYPDESPETEDKSITMSFFRSTGRQITLDISGTEGEISVEGVQEKGPYVGQRTYTITGEKIVIRGHVTALSCRGNDMSYFEAIGMESLTRIDCSDNQLKWLAIVDLPALTHLFCQQNSLQDFEIVNCPSLERVDCYENWIRGDFMTNVIKRLPVRSTPGRFMAVNTLATSSEKGNTCFVSDVALARRFGWTVVDYRNGENDENGVAYEGSEPLYFPVTFAPTEHGRVWINYPDPSRIQKDNLVVVRTEAEEGYELKKLTANGKDIKMWGGFYISEPTVVKAVFGREAAYSVSLLPIEGRGEVFIKGAPDLKQVPAQTQLTVACKPEIGYRVFAVYAGNRNITKTLSFVVTEDTEVRVIFREAHPYEDYIDIARPFVGPIELTIVQNAATVMPEIEGGKIRSVSYDKMVIDAEENMIRILAMIEGFACPSVQANQLDVTHARFLIDLNCAQNDLTQLDLSGNMLLTNLSCEGNKLSRLNFAHSPKLRFVNVCRNQIAGEGMDQLINSLPVRAPEDQAKLIVVDESFPKEGNECLPEQVARANAKGWQVYNFNGSVQVMQLYAGGENKKTRSMDAASKDRLCYYPNPTGEDITIKGAAPNTLLQLISPTGITIYSGQTNLDGEARVDLSDLPAGEYLLCIGTQTCTIIKR